MKKTKAIAGVLIVLEWRNQYTTPPNGVRKLAEIFRLYDDPAAREIPPQFDTLHVLGDGYGTTYTFPSETPRQLAPEKLASIRKQRLSRRLQAKVPMFADQFAKEEQAKNPEYFEGITRADLQEARDEIVKQEAERLKYLRQNIGKVLIYGKSHAL